MTSNGLEEYYSYSSGIGHYYEYLPNDLAEQVGLNIVQLANALKDSACFDSFNLKHLAHLISSLSILSIGVESDTIQEVVELMLLATERTLALASDSNPKHRQSVIDGLRKVLNRCSDSQKQRAEAMLARLHIGQAIKSLRTQTMR